LIGRENFSDPLTQKARASLFTRACGILTASGVAPLSSSEVSNQTAFGANPRIKAMKITGRS